MKSWFVAALFLALAGAAAGVARAGPVITEDFESYAAGSQLGSGSGGANWAGNWTVAGAYAANVTIQPQSLSYDSGSVHVSGGTKALRLTGFDATTANFVLASRPISSQSGTLYYSFLFRTTSAAGTNSDFTQFGFDNASQANPRVSIGHNLNGSLSPQDHDFFVRETTTAGNSNFTGTATQVDQTYFLVAKVSKTSGANYNKVDLWVNPSTTTEPATALETASRTGDSGLAGASYFSIRVAYLEPTDTYYLDGFRIGDSFASVVLPEPGTLALVGVGLAALVVRRRGR